LKSLLFLPAIVFFIICTILLTLPGADLPSSWFFTFIPQFDKIVHVSLFALLGLCFGYPVIKSKWLPARRLKWILFICLLCITYGIAIEFVQKWWVPGRSFEGYDILADTVGSLLAYGWNKSRVRP